MLPVMHAAYLASALLIAGLYLRLGARRHRALATAAIGVGLALLGAVFARYWGAAQGQNLAVVLALFVWLRAAVEDAAEAEPEAESEADSDTREVGT